MHCGCVLLCSALRWVSLVREDVRFDRERVCGFDAVRWFRVCVLARYWSRRRSVGDALCEQMQNPLLRFALIVCDHMLLFKGKILTFFSFFK